MTLLEWIDWTCLESVKYILCAMAIFGLSWRKGKIKYLVALYPVFVGILSINSLIKADDVIVWKFPWELLLLLVCFREKKVEKLRDFILIDFFISIVDIFVWCALGIMGELLIPILEWEESGLYSFVTNLVGACVIVILFLFRKKYQIKTVPFFKNITFQNYIFVLLAIFILSGMIGSVQGYIIGEITPNMAKVSLVCLVLFIGYFISVIFFTLYVQYRNQYLQERSQIQEKYTKIQEEFYMNSLKKYSQLQSLRHDMNHHLLLLSSMCENNQTEQMKEYLEKFGKEYHNTKIIHTGNFVTDCLVNEYYERLLPQGEVSFAGNIPEDTMGIDDMDWCILLGNVLQNAYDALEKVEGEKRIGIQIKQNPLEYIVQVTNQTNREEIMIEKTSKEDTFSHGFGVQNMKRIVEKYHGSIEWKCENYIVTVTIIIPKSDKYSDVR